MPNQGRYPLMLIHGMCQNGHALNRLSNAFASRDYDCFPATLPVHERADPAVSAYSLLDYVDDLERQFRAWAPAQPPVILGHSMGGLLALKLAERLDARALVLLTPATPAGVDGVSAAGLALAAAVLSRDLRLSKGFKPDLAAFRRTAVVGLPRAQQREVHAQLVLESGRAVLEMGLWPLDPREAARVIFGNIKCPSYLVSAGRDTLISRGAVKKLAALLPESTVRHWPRRGHMVIDDADTERMVDEICAWLTRHPPAG